VPTSAAEEWAISQTETVVQMISILAVVAIAVVEMSALHHGINGWALSSSIAAIAGLGGYHLRGVFPRRKD